MSPAPPSIRPNLDGRALPYGAPSQLAHSRAAPHPRHIAVTGHERASSSPLVAPHLDFVRWRDARNVAPRPTA